MGAERQHRPDDRELRHLLDELDRMETESAVPGKQTQAEHIEQLVPMLRHRLSAASKARGHVPPRPGQLALVGEMLSAVPKLKFDDCRALALRDVLSRLDKHPRLRDETLAAADPHVARRLGKPNLGAQQTPQGLAMWGAANQRAVTLYRRATATGIGAPETRPVAEAIGAIGKGIPLPRDVRLTLEAALGVSLDSVRLHIGQVARDAADAVCAEAFTVGEDIFFPAFDPTSRRCQETLAHEVVHTIQWRQGRIGATAGGPLVSRPDDPLEREAEREAKSIVARAFHGPVEPAPAAATGRTQAPPAATGRTQAQGTRRPTGDRRPAQVPVAMMLGPGGPAARATATSGGAHTVMRRPMIENQHPNDAPAEVSSRGILERLGDLTKTISEAPSHIMEVGGEYASLLAENWHWIGLGIVASLGIEAAIGSAYPWLVIGGNVVAQLAQGTGLAVIATSIKSHAVNWAQLGWNAHGDDAMIREASKELVRLVASVLSLASLAFRVIASIVVRWIKTYFDSAPKAGEILQTVATAKGYAVAGETAVESTAGRLPVRADTRPKHRSRMSNVPASMALVSQPESEQPQLGGGSPSERERTRRPKLTDYPKWLPSRATPSSSYGNWRQIGG